METTALDTADTQISRRLTNLSFCRSEWSTRLLVFVIAGMCVLRLMHALLPRLFIMPPLMQGWPIFAMWSGGCALILLWLIRARRQTENRPSGRPSVWKCIREVAIAFGLTIIWLVLVAVLATVIEEMLPEVDLGNDRFRNVEEAPPGAWAIGLMLYGAVVMPIIEEVLFRGFIYNAFRKRMPNHSAAILQGLLFGVMHDYHILGMLIVGAGGICLAMLYRWRQTLLTPILMHCMFNGVVFASMLYAGQQRWQSPIIGINPAADARGCVIAVVIEGAPAELSGLQKGDTITGFGKYRIETFEDLQLATRYYKPGDVVTIWYDRLQESYTTEVELTSRQALFQRQQELNKP